MNINANSPYSLLEQVENLDREDLLKLVKNILKGGVALTFYGKHIVKEIVTKVRPRVMRRDPKLHVGPPEEQAKNLLIEGENLQAMVTLYKYWGQVDLILTDPPFNTGQHFRYNDKWDQDPNDPGLGEIVSREDGARHTKWIKAMLPRLHMMKKMLKAKGVIAICIDENELFHLGMMMDEVFGENNRIAIINWQKSYASKNSSQHISSATEYVLVYAKDKELAKTIPLPRTEKMNSRYKNPDNDPEGPWRDGNPTAKDFLSQAFYGIQNPFTGQFFYPEPNCHWRHKKATMKEWLQEWGYHYIELKDPETPETEKRHGKTLALEGSYIEKGRIVTPEEVLEKAKKAAEEKLSGVIPRLYFYEDGQGGPSIKTYLKHVKRGKVPITFWAEEDYESPLDLGSQSWSHTESGHSQGGVKGLAEIVGVGHNFETVKPLKLFEKIVQIWCPNTGLVLDPYAGSGTTGHAVLKINHETGSKRRFILVEQGSPEDGDKYARTLTWRRLKNVVEGKRVDKAGKEINIAEPLGGGFEFRMLTKQVDAKTILAMKRDELIDIVITSHWDENYRNSPSLTRIDDPKYEYLVGQDDRGEGYFLIWNGKDAVGQLDRDTYKQVLKEAQKFGIEPPYNIYARYEVYQSPNVRFWKIPDKILAHLGLNENSDRFNEEDEET